jgi:hypothetical protein
VEHAPAARPAREMPTRKAGGNRALRLRRQPFVRAWLACSLLVKDKLYSLLCARPCQEVARSCISASMRTDRELYLYVVHATRSIEQNPVHVCWARDLVSKALQGVQAERRPPPHPPCVNSKRMDGRNCSSRVGRACVRRCVTLVSNLVDKIFWCMCAREGREGRIPACDVGRTGLVIRVASCKHGLLPSSSPGPCTH